MAAILILHRQRTGESAIKIYCRGPCGIIPWFRLSSMTSIVPNVSVVSVRLRSKPERGMRLKGRAKNRDLTIRPPRRQCKRQKSNTVKFPQQRRPESNGRTFLRVAGDGWRVTGSGWRVAGEGQRVTGDGWRVAGGGFKIYMKIKYYY